MANSPSTTDSGQVKLPLSPEQQLTQLGEQYEYVQAAIDRALDDEDQLLLEALGNFESGIQQRVAELTEHGITPFSTAVSEQGGIVETEVAEAFGDVSEIAGVKSAKLIRKDNPEASVLRDSELSSIKAYTPKKRKRGEQDQHNMDAIEIETESGARFRVIDATLLFSSQARESFVRGNGDRKSGKTPRQEAMRALLKEWIVMAESGFSKKAPRSVRALPEVKCVRPDRDHRAYYMVTSSELRDSQAEAPDRTFTFVGDCSKSTERNLYKTLFGISM